MKRRYSLIWRGIWEVNDEIFSSQWCVPYFPPLLVHWYPTPLDWYTGTFVIDVCGPLIGTLVPYFESPSSLARFEFARAASPDPRGGLF